MPLPADLFSGLESLTVEPPTLSQTGPIVSTAADSAPSTQSTTAAAAAAAAAAVVRSGPALSGPSIPSQPHSQPGSTLQTTSQLPSHVPSTSTLQGSSLAPAPVAAPAAVPEARRKKKTTRRVGYARDQTEDRPAERIASGSSSLRSPPLASAALPSTHTPSVAVPSLPTKSATAAAAAAAAATPPLLSAQPSSSVPPAVRTPAADAQQHGKPVTTGSTGSPMRSLQEQASPSQPASPAKAAAAQSLPTAGGSPKMRHKAAIPQAPPTVVQLASLSLPEAVAAASFAAPVQVMLPASSQGHKALPAALTAETLVQVVLTCGLFYQTCQPLSFAHSTPWPHPDSTTQPPPPAPPATDCLLSCHMMAADLHC